MVVKGNLLGLVLLAGAAHAIDVPSNVKSLYQSIKSQGQCKDFLATGFYSAYNDDNSFGYCGDHLDSDGVIYLTGKGGQFANMDVDCDGVQGSAADDGRCGSSGDTQSQTSFQYQLSQYGAAGVADLDANIHSYVVFGNVGSEAEGYTSFDPQRYGVEPLSVMAVVCGDKLVFGVWGDENGDDGAKSVVGEASIALATLCYGTGVNGNSGHDEADVLYLAFAGKDAVPGKDGVDWAAKDRDAFQASLAKFGDKLVKGLAAKKVQSAPKAMMASPAAGNSSSLVRRSLEGMAWKNVSRTVGHMDGPQQSWNSSSRAGFRSLRNGTRSL
ncbi:fungal chitosanase of glycosyl hydrolase group 75-domain-containing protein [Biscogniauxia sp. FL1348]|nr:fungal chitosanase of glycosyl hydrolase group 75-domain-containing protein [Biscogniauxia sp. FL1348]